MLTYTVHVQLSDATCHMQVQHKCHKYAWDDSHSGASLIQHIHSFSCGLHHFLRSHICASQVCKVVIGTNVQEIDCIWGGSTIDSVKVLNNLQTEHDSCLTAGKHLKLWYASSFSTCSCLPCVVAFFAFLAIGVFIIYYLQPVGAMRLFDALNTQNHYRQHTYAVHPCVVMQIGGQDN